LRVSSRAWRTGAVCIKAAGDSNANALDAGLEALVAFLTRADEEFAARCVAQLQARWPVRRVSADLNRRVASSCAPVLAPSLVSKGLSARPKTVARASEALFLLIELDAAETTLVSRQTLLASSAWRR
jgi:hypothetical protein